MADVDDERSHCYREILEHRETRETRTTIAADGSVVTSAGEIVRTEMFLCGRLGPPCEVCGAVSEVLCDFPIGEEQRTCDRPLCERCAPTVGIDKNFCPEHTLAGAGPNMVLFKRPIPTREQLNKAAMQGLERDLAPKKKQRRLPRPPPPDKRWQVWQRKPQCCLTRWMTQLEAYRMCHENPGKYGILTWDAFVAWHRKQYPLAPRKPRKPRRESAPPASD